MTAPVTSSLVPELRYRSLQPGWNFEEFRTGNADIIGAAAPYWAVAWPGGLALARYLLDVPSIVSGFDVVDLGCGNGLAAAAAMRAGASSAVAVDIDANALLAAEETAFLNGVSITTCQAPIDAFSPERRSIILSGDLWYDRRLGRQASAALANLCSDGHTAYFGDAGRPGRPRRNCVRLATYPIPPAPEFDHEFRSTATVYRVSSNVF